MADSPAAPTPTPPPHNRRPPHTWPQRAVLTFNSVLVVGCLAAAALIFYGNQRASERLVAGNGLPTASSIAAGTTVAPPQTADTQAPTGPTTTTDDWAGEYTGDLSARNFLITGQSSTPCVDADDPTAGGFGAGNTESHLTDSIMIMRISPATNQAAVLSFPRDLWVTINGRNGSGRINSAFDPTNPDRLAFTIFENFGIPIDHYININLCMFKTLVDAVGGVKVPFEYHVYDKNVGLDIEPGCQDLNGSQALAWVRTRKLRYTDPATGEEKKDESSDYGRISRQQDFLRRLAAKAISSGLTKPGAAKTFLEAYLGSGNVITDPELTIGKMLDFVNAMRSINPTLIRTYRVETVSEPHGGASTLGLAKNSEFNDQVLSVFRGQSDLAAISTDPTDTTVADVTATTVPNDTATTLPVVDPLSNPIGIVPPDDPSCK